MGDLDLPDLRDGTFDRLATVTEAERTALLIVRFEALALVTETERRQQCRTMISSLDRLNALELAEVTASRIAALLLMDEAAARVVGRSYEAVLDAMPAETGRSNAVAAQPAIYRLPPAAVSRLRAIAPRLLVRATQPISTTGDVPAPPARPNGTRR